MTKRQKAEMLYKSMRRQGKNKLPEYIIKAHLQLMNNKNLYDALMDRGYVWNVQTKRFKYSQMHHKIAW